MTFKSLFAVPAGRGRQAVSFFFALAGVVALAAPACSSSSAGNNATQAESCALNSDCAKDLICAFGKCTVACMTDSDCGSGGMCVVTAATAAAPAVAACQSPAQANASCNSEADCPSPLACASDFRCRNLCTVDADCNVLGITGKVCAADMNGVHYCASMNDVSASGVINEAPPSGATGTVTEPGDASGLVLSADATMGGASSSGGHSSSGGGTSSGGTSSGAGGSSGGSGCSCGLGQLCVDGGCVACGSAAGDICCAGSACGNNLTCVSGVCACGAPGEACCNGSQCNNSVTCSGGICACGTAGNACCPAGGSAPACGGSLQCTGLDCTCQLACSGSVVQRSDGTLWSYYSTLAPVTDASDTKIVATSFSAYYETYGSSGLGCYVDSGSHVWCWGANSEGQLGNASQSQTASSVPVEVVTDTTGTPLANITSVAVDSAEGYLACAIDTSTDVWCWGYGSNGVQGSGYTYNNPYASQVVTNSSMTPFSGAVSLAVTYDHVCATVIGSNGAGGPYQLWCWGSNNYGQIGVGSTTTTSYNYPQYVSNLYSSVAQVSVSEYVTCAVTSDSSVWCWGYNGYGNLGNGLTTGNAYVPAQVQLSTADAGTPTYFTGAASVQLGGYYYGSPCARKTDGSLWCWGEYSSSASYLPQPYVQSQVPVRQTFALCPNGYGSDPSYIDLTGSFNESGSKVSTQISCP